MMISSSWTPIIVSFIPACVLPFDHHFAITIIAHASLVALLVLESGPTWARSTPRILVLIVLRWVRVRLILLTVSVARAATHMVRVTLALPRLHAAECGCIPMILPIIWMQLSMMMKIASSHVLTLALVHSTADTA